MWGGQLDVKSI